MSIERWSISDYCKQADSSSPKLFDNPVIFDCYNENNCNLKGLISDDVYFFQTGSFSKTDLPPEYWPAYIKEIEKVITGLIDKKPSSSYPHICSNDQNKY